MTTTETDLALLRGPFSNSTVVTAERSHLHATVILRIWDDITSGEHKRFDLTIDQARSLAASLTHFAARQEAWERHTDEAIARLNTPEEGVDRCACGSKYWDGDRCHSCGDRFVR